MVRSLIQSFNIVEIISIVGIKFNSYNIIHQEFSISCNHSWLVYYVPMHKDEFEADSCCQKLYQESPSFPYCLYRSYSRSDISRYISKKAPTFYSLGTSTISHLQYIKTHLTKQHKKQATFGRVESTITPMKLFIHALKQLRLSWSHVTYRRIWVDNKTIQPRTCAYLYNCTILFYHQKLQQ